MTTLREFFVNGTMKRFAPQFQKRLTLANAYKEIADTAAGQIVIRDILAFGGVLDIDEACAGDEAAYRLGRRATAMHVIGRLRWSEGELLQLGQEVTWETLTQYDSEQQGQAA